MTTENKETKHVHLKQKKIQNLSELRQEHYYYYYKNRTRSTQLKKLANMGNKKRKKENIHSLRTIRTYSRNTQIYILFKTQMEQRRRARRLTRIQSQPWFRRLLRHPVGRLRWPLFLQLRSPERGSWARRLTRKLYSIVTTYFGELFPLRHEKRRPQKYDAQTSTCNAGQTLSVTERLRQRS